MFAHGVGWLQNPSRWGGCVLAMIGLLLADGVTHAGYEIRTFDVTYSNTYADGGLTERSRSNLTTGSIMGPGPGGLQAGRVKFTVSADNLAIYGDTSGQNYGWGSFAFNTLLNTDLEIGRNLVELDPDATLYKNMKVGLDETANYSEYGWFDWVLTWNPSTKQDTFSFQIDTGDDLLARVDNFVQLSRSSKDLNGAAATDGMLYAGHIMGYGANREATRSVAGQPPSPPPSRHRRR